MIDYYACTCNAQTTISCPACVQYLRSKRSKGVKMVAEKVYLPMKAKYKILSKFGIYLVTDKFHGYFIGVSRKPVDYRRDKQGEIIERYYEKPHELWFNGDYVVEKLADPVEIMVYSYDGVLDDDYEITQTELEFLDELEF